MLSSAQRAIDIMDRMEESYRQFRETLLEMKSPAPQAGGIGCADQKDFETLEKGNEDHG